MKLNKLISGIIMCVSVGLIMMSCFVSTVDKAAEQSAPSKYLGLQIVGDYKIRGTKIVEYIGGYDKAKTITIPKQITEIEEHAFSIDDDIVSMDQFTGMQKVSLCIPKNVKIDKLAFQCTGPMNITFEEGRTKIEDSAFYACYDYGFAEYGKTEITLPSTIKSIGKYSFGADLNNKIILNLNEGLEVIEDKALLRTKCKLPSTVKKLGNYAMYDWSEDDVEGELSGGDVELPNGLTEIGNSCIYIEHPTKKIRIPASVRKIGEKPIIYGDRAYDGGVVVDKKNRYYKSNTKGWLYSKDGKNLLYAACYKGNLVIPEGVEYVGNGSLHIDLKRKGGSLKIILPKSLKKYNGCAANAHSVVFQGNPPKLVGNRDFPCGVGTFYVPKSKLKEYKKVFRSWRSDCCVKGE